MENYCIITIPKFDFPRFTSRSVTGYGQIRLQGEECRGLYYKVKVLVQSKHDSKKNSRMEQIARVS